MYLFRFQESFVERSLGEVRCNSLRARPLHTLFQALRTPNPCWIYFLISCAEIPLCGSLSTQQCTPQATHASTVHRHPKPSRLRTMFLVGSFAFLCLELTDLDIKIWTSCCVELALRASHFTYHCVVTGATYHDLKVFGYLRPLCSCPRSQHVCQTFSVSACPCLLGPRVCACLLNPEPKW